MGFTLLALGLVLLNAKYTRTEIWGQWPLEGNRRRWQRCVAGTMITTTLAIILFLVVGIALGYREGGWIAVGDRILNRKILIAITVYFPWALLQQTLFQFYLLGRVRVLWPSLHPLSHATLNGLVFALVHLPDIWIALMTALGGTVWSFLYIRYRLVWPLALSHALVGSTFYYWVYGHDLADEWSPIFTSLLKKG